MPIYFNEDTKAEIYSLSHYSSDMIQLCYLQSKNKGGFFIDCAAPDCAAYAGFSPKDRSRMLRRVRRAYDEENSPGISLKDYLNFYQVLVLTVLWIRDPVLFDPWIRDLKKSGSGIRDEHPRSFFRRA
jgi:hypothetical protein